MKNITSLVKNLPTIVLSIAMMVIVVYMFYPGIINADSAYQLLQAKSFEFTDWHPPIMSFLWSLLNHIHAGVESMLVFHNLVFWCGLSLLAFWISPKSNLCRIMFLLFFGFFPTVLAQLGMVIKDTSMAVSLFLVSVLFLYAKRISSRRKYCLLLVAVVFLFYGFETRLNSAPAVLVLCLWFGDVLNNIDHCSSCHCKEYQRQCNLEDKQRNAINISSKLIGIGLFILLSLANYIMTENFLRPIKTYPFQQVQVHDLAALSLAEKRSIFPGYIAKNPTFNMERLQQFYTPANVGGLLFGRDAIIPLANNKSDIRDLNLVWLRNIYQHPWSYLYHRSQVFGYVLSGCMSLWDDTCRISLANFSYQPGFFYNIYCSFTLNGPLKFLFHSWVYIINSVVVAAVAIRLRRRLQNFSAIIYLVASGLLYVAGSFFYAPSCEFRYVYWEVMASLLAVSLLIKDIFSGEKG